MMSATLRIRRPCLRAKTSRSGMRAMVPSSFMISQMTPEGVRPARRAMSTEPSVWPVRTRTPPRRARSGKIWPGVMTSSGRASGLAATRIVWARSAALIPVLTPWRASMLTVKAVPRAGPRRPGDSIIGSLRRSICSSVSATQMRPRPCVAMKLMASGVTNCPTIVRSPSFSRSSSSTRMTILPARMSAMALAMRSVSLGSIVTTGRYLDSALGPHGQQAPNVARDEVHLQVDRVALAKRAEVGLLERVRDDGDVEAIGSDGVDGEADPFDRDRALLGHERRELARDAEGQRQGVTHRTALEQRAEAVDVTRHDVAAHPIGGAQGPLEVHGAPGLQAAQRRPRQRLGGGVDLEAVARDRVDRQARTVHGDRLPERERSVVEAGGQSQTRPRPTRVPGGQRSGGGHEAGEHGALARCSGARPGRPGKLSPRAPRAGMPPGGYDKLSVVRLVAACAFLGLAAVGGSAACGPSFQAVYECDVHFEHCYALDQGGATVEAQKECWRDWLHGYTYGQSRDRVEYGGTRLSYLSLDPTLPSEDVRP